MINATPGAKPPKTKRPPRSTPMVEPTLPSAESLTSAEYEQALDTITSDHGALVIDCLHAASHDAAVELIRARLLTGAFMPYRRDGLTLPTTEAWHFTAVSTGVLVECDDRKSVLAWLEIAEFIRNDRDEEGADEDETMPGASLLNGAKKPIASGQLSPEIKAKPTRAKKAPSITSTTTPAGIREHDPDVVRRPPESVELYIDLVKESPRNARRMFPAESIESLAGLIKQDGLLNPVLVRRLAGGTYEVIAGHRRLRASKLAGLQSIRATIHDVANDRQADELALIDNLAREDLDLIEEAAGYQDLATRYGLTHQAVAARVGKEEGYVGQRVRLLELPKVWQDKIRTRVLKLTHARWLVTYADQPAALKAVHAKLFDKQGRYQGTTWGPRLPAGEMPAHDEFRRHLESRLQRDVWRDLKATIHAKHGYGTLPPLKPTKEQLATLDVVKIGGREVARNVKAYEALVREHRKLHDKSQPKAKGGDKTKGKAKPPSAAQIAAKREAAREKLAKALRDDWLSAWQCYVCSVAATAGGDARLLQLALWMGISNGGDLDDGHMPDKVLGVKSAKWSDRERLRIEASADPDKAAAALRKLAGEAFWGARVKRPSCTFGGGAIDAICKAWSIDLAAEWRANLAGPCMAKFWELHEDWQLDELGDEYELDVRGFKGTKAKIAFLTKNRAFRAKLPASIAAAMAPAPKKAKGKR